MNFLPLETSMQNMYQKYFDLCKEKTSDYTFLNIWAWADYYGLCLAESDNLVWIQEKNNVFRAPVGNWEEIDFTKIDFFNEERKLIRVPESLKNILIEQFKDGAIAEEDINNNEYIYTQSSLASLSGNKMHKKKNHYNSFRKTYGIDYRPFTSSTITDEFKKDLHNLQDDWCLWNDCLDDAILRAEGLAIQELIKQIELFPQVFGASLYVENRLVAFTFGERLDERCLVVHFEKAHPDYRGAYQAINKCFAEHAGNGYDFINREQDSGNEGLRHAKASYYPSHFLNKFTVTIKK